MVQPATWSVAQGGNPEKTVIVNGEFSFSSIAADAASKCFHRVRADGVVANSAVKDRKSG